MGRDHCAGELRPPHGYARQDVERVSVERQPDAGGAADALGKPVDQPNRPLTLSEAGPDERRVVGGQRVEHLSRCARTVHFAPRGLVEGDVGDLGQRRGDRGNKAARRGQSDQARARAHRAGTGEVGRPDEARRPRDDERLAEGTLVGRDRAVGQPRGDPIGGGDFKTGVRVEAGGDADVRHGKMPHALSAGEEEEPDLGIAEGDGRIRRRSGGVDRAGVGVEAGWHVEGKDERPAPIRFRLGESAAGGRRWSPATAWSVPCQAWRR